MAALIDEKILCMHGGLSPDLRSLDQIRNIAHPVDVPNQGLLGDLLWGPDKDASKVGEKMTEVVEDGYEFFANRVVTIFSRQIIAAKFDNA
ncbi:hypothetical protein IFM89_035520 [Coptis chinensis]|uniref:Calcineurin-like phosphoesterase domain-containing protein n=1 Tax=Coptis chinensis TaxID=261450 RepID=A0A835H7B6_9MAGN|nr:hypothetical protein IFM89_035520 [Coptis chinensis]